MSTNCRICRKQYKNYQVNQLNCKIHHACLKCTQKFQNSTCFQCQNKLNVNSIQYDRLYLYPVQGTMVNFHKIYNKKGQSQFSAKRNCKEKFQGWMSLFFLSLVFFFSGISIAIATTEKGTGIIMAIVGFIGLFFAIFFMIKIRKNKQLYNQVQNEGKNFELVQRNQGRPYISSARSSKN